MSQFSPLIQIPAAKLVAGVENRIDLPQLCDKLWLPSTVVIANAIVANAINSIAIGIRINLQSAPMLPWGLNANEVCRFDGPVETIFVSLLSGAATNVYLMGTRDVSLTYSGFMFGAGTPDNTTTGG